VPFWTQKGGNDYRITNSRIQKGYKKEKENYFKPSLLAGAGKSSKQNPEGAPIKKERGYKRRSDKSSSVRGDTLGHWVSGKI